MLHKTNVIYKMENLTNGKIYIGKTTRELRIRIHEHIYSNKNYPVDKAVKKYGIEMFDIDIIAEADTEEELDALESFFIEFYTSKKPEGYNLTEGGEGCNGLIFTKQHRQRIAEKASLRVHTQSTKDKISKNKKGQGKGIPLKPETVAKMIENSPLSKSVICIETSKIFTSIKAAARSWGLKSDESLRKACHGKNKTAAGYHWAFIDKNGNLLNSVPKGNLRNIICIESGKIFKSTIEAAKWAGVSRNSISKVCRNEMKTAGGYHWKYIDAETAKN